MILVFLGVVSQIRKQQGPPGLSNPYKQGVIQSVWDDIKTYSSRMLPPPSGLVWGWFGGDSRAILGVKLAILPPPGWFEVL